MGRARPSASYRLLVDADAVGPAHTALLQAQQHQRHAHAMVGKGRTAAIRKADQAVAAAQAAFDACYEVIAFTALEPDAVEALMAEHPPTREELAKAAEARDEAQKRGDRDLPDWPDTADTYRPALLAACCDNGMSADDWTAFLKSNVSEGERADLWLHVVSVNARTRIADPLVIPKELTQMLSSLSNLTSAPGT